MGKVTNKHKLGKPPRKQLVFCASEWTSLQNAFARAKATLSSRELAMRDLIEHLRKARLASLVRYVTRDGSERFECLKPSFWEMANYDAFRGRIRVDLSAFAGSRKWVFVSRAHLEKLYPAPVYAPAGLSPDIPNRPKPGPKARGDWPTLLGAWLIMVACDDPQRLRNVDVLVTEAQIFLEEQIGWAPKEPKELRKKIVDFLRFVPRG
jgi:hypothetical protein